jgi:hypothetical protein
MSVQSKVAYSFNKFYLNFLKDLKTNEELRPEIKKHYKVFDKFTTLHIEKLRDCNELIAGRSLESLLGVVDAAEHVTIKTYDVIFKILLHVFNDENATLNTLSTVIQTIKHIRDGDELSMEAFLDDDLSSMLTSLRELLAQDSKVNLNDLAPDTEDTFKLFENSMIGSLAKEISEEINIADLDIKDPTEFLKIENLSDSNNVLGSIVHKVSSKIQNKIQSGNLKQSDLISEAMSLMGMLNNNSATSSIFNNVMSEMGKNMTAAHNGASTRARLQKKLAARKAE